MDVPKWTDEQGPEFVHKRSIAISDIIQNRKMGHLRKVIASGWNVNESFCRTYNKSMVETALHIASSQGWTEGVELLFDAGAIYKTPGEYQTALYLAIENHNCPVAIIEVLLKHGADPNDHDGKFVPLLQALDALSSGFQVAENFTRIVQVLLEYGADPNVICKVNPLSTALGKTLECLFKMPFLTPFHCHLQGKEKASVLFKMLTHFGADVNCKQPLLHKMLGTFLSLKEHSIPNSCFLQQHLDIYFQYGGNIQNEYEDLGTGLEWAVQQGCHINSIRWLIRHGADTSTLKFSFLRGVFGSEKLQLHTDQAALVLLEAGMRVPQGTHQHLIKMEKEITKLYTWDQMKKVEGLQRTSKKLVFPEYLSKQMIDLEDFSDESLHVYPGDKYGGHSYGQLSRLKQKDLALHQVRLVLEFLCQPQSLQWYCRRCVRESLVSLQPSVVKTIPGPSILKRYILCHEL